MTLDRQLNIDQQKRAYACFDELLDATEDVRRQRLAEIAADDPAVAAEVSDLLAADAVSDSVVDADLGQVVDALSDDGVFGGLPPRFGDFHVEEFINDGGMGAVYRARREKLDDIVALKVLHPWVAAHYTELFTVEQKTLASLKHPNIAHMHVAGVTNGLSWFAMEYVEQAVTLKAWCHRPERKVDLRGRLELFRAVCAAVDYAHSRAVIHYDLKPSNILVDVHGRLKLVDFGIAQKLREHTRDADKGSELASRHAMTLNYASPEQYRGEEAHVGMDVYSLGVVLFELLTGRVPVDRADAAELDKLFDQPPPAPSSVAPVNGADMAITKAEWRELDAICLKALHPDKEKRYQKVADLDVDLKALLAHRPLPKARDGRLRYKTRLFLTRNRRAVMAAALALVVLGIVSGGLTKQLIHARAETRLSDARAEEIQGVLILLLEGGKGGEAAGPDADTTVVELLRRGELTAADISDPLLRADLLNKIGSMYHKLGQHESSNKLLSSAWRIRMSMLGKDDPRTIAAVLSIVDLRIDQREYGEAETIARESLAVAERRATVDPVEMANARARLGRVLVHRGQYKEAIPSLEQAIDTLSFGDRAALRERSSVLSDAIGDLANARYYRGEIESARVINERGLVFDREMFGARHPNVAVDLFNLGNIALDRGDYGGALRQFQEARTIAEDWYPAPHPRIAQTLQMVGRTLAYQEQRDEAKRFYDQALEQYKRTYVPTHPRIGSVYSYMGDVALDEGQLGRAETLYGQTRDIFAAGLGTDHEFYLHQLSNLANVSIARGDYAAAEAALRPVVARLRELVPDQRLTALAELRFAKALNKQKRHREALAVGVSGYQRLSRGMGPNSAEMGEAREILAETYAGLGQPENVRELTVIR